MPNIVFRSWTSLRCHHMEREEEKKSWTARYLATKTWFIIWLHCY